MLSSGICTVSISEKTLNFEVGKLFKFIVYQYDQFRPQHAQTSVLPAAGLDMSSSLQSISEHLKVQLLIRSYQV